MSDDWITIPVTSDLHLRDVDELRELHARFGLVLMPKDTRVPLTWGFSFGDRGELGAARLVTELFRLARFALLVSEIAECRPTDTVVDVVNQVLMEIRSRP